MGIKNKKSMDCHLKANHVDLRKWKHTTQNEKPTEDIIHVKSRVTAFKAVNVAAKLNG
jgi:hypothetical protein